MGHVEGVKGRLPTCCPGTQRYRGLNGHEQFYDSYSLFEMETGGIHDGCWHFGVLRCGDHGDYLDGDAMAVSLFVFLLFLDFFFTHYDTHWRTRKAFHARKKAYSSAIQLQSQRSRWLAKLQKQFYLLNENMFFQQYSHRNIMSCIVHFVDQWLVTLSIHSSKIDAIVARSAPMVSVLLLSSRSQVRTNKSTPNMCMLSQNRDPFRTCYSVHPTIRVVMCSVC